MVGVVKSWKANPGCADVHLQTVAGVGKIVAWAKRYLSGVPIASPSKAQRVQSLGLATLWTGNTVATMLPLLLGLNSCQISKVRFDNTPLDEKRI